MNMKIIFFFDEGQAFAITKTVAKINAKGEKTSTEYMGLKVKRNKLKLI